MTFIKETYTSRAAEYIRELIRTGSLVPGQPIRENMISEALGISHAPILEALLLLAEQGLIENEPHKGKRVATIDPETIFGRYKVAGILLGAGAAEAVALWTEKDRKRFEEAAGRIAAIGESCDPDEIARLDGEFHDCTICKCPNAYLVSTARNSCSCIAKFLYQQQWRALLTPAEYRRRHMRIAEAVLAGDPARIEKTLRRHYEDTGRLMAEMVLRCNGREKS